METPKTTSHSTPASEGFDLRTALDACSELSENSTETNPEPPGETASVPDQDKSPDGPSAASESSGSHTSPADAAERQVVILVEALRRLGYANTREQTPDNQNIEHLRREAYLKGRNDAIDDFKSSSRMFAPVGSRSSGASPEPSGFLAGRSPGFWETPDPLVG